jgi:two-component system phosphate regulon sensor histidine kinase PhoR
MITRVRADKRGMQQECRLDDRSFICNLSYLPVQDGVVLVFHDLTELRRVEDLKKDFVVNASHELRTPLQAIRGAADLLEDDPAGSNRAAALEILRRHADRLTFLVDDLLKLGELEARGFRLDLRPVDLAGLSAAILKSLEPAARKKGLELELDAAPGLPLVPADADQIERLLLNLLDNAVKYTDRGRVVLRLRLEGESAVIEVSDTGIGIAAEHQARIFERFYVVDKSRSRRLGGTGLGLAIVKHVAQLHGGSVEIRSEEGRGTTFTVRIPQRPRPGRD